MSQLNLALAANVSPRHLSFLETGRSMPSQAMVLKLCDCLELPHAACNLLMAAAGYNQVYHSPDLDEEALAPFRAAVASTLDNHLPYPATAVDQHGMLVDLNRSAANLYRPHGLTKGDHFILHFTDFEHVKARYDNWEEVLRGALATARAYSQLRGGHPLFDEAIAKIVAAVPEEISSPLSKVPPILPVRLKTEKGVITYITIVVLFPTSHDLVLGEISVILYFPVDEACREFFLALAEEDGS